MNLLIILLSLINPSLKEETVVIKKEYEISNPNEMTIIVDNINGDVEIESSDDNKLYLTVEIKISGYSEKLVEKAKNELKLGEILADDSLMFFTKAPFVKRSKWGGFDMNDHPKYAFKYQYKLKVPKQVSLVAQTINNGDVIIENHTGPIRACNVNGGIEIENAMEVRKASTVNGDVRISFLKSPQKDIYFHTVNGDFHFELPKDFSAQIYFDTMNGDLYTSFDYRKMGPKVTKSEKNGTFKIGSNTGVEIGTGGPELSFKSINGNVYLDKS